MVLDQAWVKFDIERAAFVSLGKQHVKWGTGHIWNPTDALNPQHLDPLQPYDLRLGANLLTIQVPWAGTKQSNLCAIALLDNPQPASTTQQGGGAFRAETVPWRRRDGPGRRGAGRLATRSTGRTFLHAPGARSTSTPRPPCSPATILPSYQYLAKPTAGSDLKQRLRRTRWPGHARSCR